jgi:hypothetical protein
MGRIPWRMAGTCLVVLWTLSASGCGSEEFESTYCRTPVVIDGSDSDWVHALTDVEKAKAFIGVRNDDQYLYLCVECENHAVSQQIQMSGLTVWFDPEGGEREVLGIHYPLGMRDAGGMPAGGAERAPRGPGEGAAEGGFRGEPGVEAGADSGGPARGGLRDNPRMTRAGLKEIEILGPGKGHRRRTELSELKGIQVAVGNLAGAMIYELRVPLSAMPDIPYVLGARPGAPLGIRFQTGTFDMRQMMGEGRPGGRPSGGGRRGGGGGGFPGGGGEDGPEGGGPGGGRGGGPGGGGPGMPGAGSRSARISPIDAHMVVRLASDSTIEH